MAERTRGGGVCCAGWTAAEGGVYMVRTMMRFLARVVALLCAVLFVPVAVGLVAWLEPLRQSFGLIMLCVVLGIVLILGAVGHLYQRMNKP